MKWRTNRLQSAVCLCGASRQTGKSLRLGVHQQTAEPHTGRHLLHVRPQTANCQQLSTPTTSLTASVCDCVRVCVCAYVHMQPCTRVKQEQQISINASQWQRVQP